MVLNVSDYLLLQTDTPPLIFTPDLIQMMRNISDLVNVHWYLGVPFNDTNWRLQIVETGQAILGDFLIGIQAGNEPDLYANHGRRPEVSLLFLRLTALLIFGWW